MKKLLLVLFAVLGFHLSQAQVSEEFLAQFSTEAMREFVKDYDVFVSEIIEIIVNEDEEGINSLEIKSEIWAQKAGQIMENMTEHDIDLWMEYTKLINERFTKATSAATERIQRETYEIGEERPEKGEYIRK